MESLLRSLQLIDSGSVKEFFPRVRDREDIKVMRCAKSGVIFLSRSDHIIKSYYKMKGGERSIEWGDQGRKKRIGEEYIGKQISEDVVRIRGYFKRFSNGAKWLDFGAGYGEIIEALSEKDISISALEPNEELRQYLRKRGYKVYASLSEIGDERFDLITLFHVFEHLTDPIGILRTLKSKLSDDGYIILEVPHGRDFLIKALNCLAFKKFTFWSEHLILHTRESLKTFIRESGFENISIYGTQRYPFSNHLYWLLRGEPGGHKKWEFLNVNLFNKMYARFLKLLDQTDTLTAIIKSEVNRQSS